MRFSSFLGHAVAGTLFFSLALLTTRASAGPPARVTLGGDPFSCSTPTVCSSDVDCGGGETCIPFSGTDGGSGACLAPASPLQELWCCDVGDTCPGLRGIGAGTCTQLISSESGERLGFAVCVYPGSEQTFCADDGEAGITDEDIRQCLTGADGSSTASRWLDGDCDGDHCPNQFDPSPCSADGACSTVSRDGGVSGDVDAGLGSPDGGNLEDGGSPGDPDGGEALQDGGPTSGFDAGSGTPGEVSFHGEGGCDCRAASTPASAGWSLACGALLGLAVALRRRGRSRREPS